MKCSPVSVLRTFIVLFLVLAPAAFAEFQAGSASVDVTPDPLLPVTGGLGPPQPVTTAKGRLEIRALVLADADTRTVIVSVPFIGFPSVLCDQVRARVEGIPPENIMIGSTHTHSAPDMYAFLDEEGNPTADMDYVEEVVKSAAAAVNKAAAKLQPASIRINSGEAAERIAYNAYAPELYDPRCNVLQALDANGDAIATLVNYAIHPEVLGPKRGILSPDMVGPLYDRIAAQGGGMGIFMNGAQGGMVTADNRRDVEDEAGTWEECIRIGALLADEALRIVAEAPVQESPTLWCGARDLDVPVDNLDFREMLKGAPLDYAMSSNFEVTTQLNILNVGNAQMLTIPGEALPNIGYYLKRQMQGEHNFLLGLTNDAFGYILTEEDFGSFRRYDYITRTSMGERTWPVYQRAALAFIHESPRPEETVAE